MRRRRVVGPPPAPAGELSLFGPPARAGSVAEPGRYDRREAPRDTLLESGGVREVIPGASVDGALPVSVVTRLARDVIEGAFVPLWVRGEVSDFKAHRNGHWYFCLRDDEAQLRCVVWSRDRRAIPASPDDGMQVTALGRLGVYAARGEMQFVVTALVAAGDGLRRKALELTRARLDADGLLDPARRRRIPRAPRCVAVVTSPSGAALRDIIAVIRRRCPGVRIVLVPAAVQGESAPAELAAAIDRVSRWGEADTLIVGRGGGAREDLWAFNDERVARALAGCRLPTISAVGHEVDITLCDLVADLRAATPSAAAEAAVPVLEREQAALAAHEEAMRRAVARRLAAAAERWQRGARRMRQAAALGVERRRLALDAAAGRLHALSPLAVLGRGYTLARDPDGRALTSSAHFSPGQPFDLLLHDGEVSATTLGVRQAPPAGA